MQPSPNPPGIALSPTPRALSGAPRTGSGVAIGFVDYGFDLLHPSMLRPGEPQADLPDIQSRFAALLDQNTGELFARVYPGDQPDISCEASRSRPVRPLDRHVADALEAGDRTAIDGIYDPHRHYYDRTDGQYGAHGTMMASIAMAAADGCPDIDVLAVQMALPEAGWREIDGAGRPSWRDWDPGAEPIWNGWRSYLHHAAFVDAIEWLHTAAVRRGNDALVINLSLGTWAGAHDGRSPVELKIAEVLGRSRAGVGPVTAIVVPMGNAGADRGHAAGTVSPGQPWSVAWRFGATAIAAGGDNGPHKLEIWYEADRPCAVDIAVDGTSHRLPVPIGPTSDLRVGGVRVGVADHRLQPNGAGPGAIGLNAVRISCCPATLAGALAGLTVSLTAHDPWTGPSPVPVHAWIERSGDGRAHSWLDPHDPTCSLSGLATAPGALVVGALDTVGSGAPRIFAASGLGPHPWRRSTACALPTRWAAGHRVRAARSKHAGTTVTSGTSAACAHVSGWLAAHFAIARARALRDGGDVRTAVQTTLRSAMHAGAMRVGPDIPAPTGHRATRAMHADISSPPAMPLETMHP